ncbi:MAG: nucleotidyltransferase family protein [Candidatus Omnitrophota bacterium]|nr:nucleotidyltransferase family protein [Candidatus Omnitrophota bacterium]
MNFIAVLKFIIKTFGRENVKFALIGGFALQVAGVTRTTKDIDLLVLSENSAKIKNIMLKHGYEIINENEDVLNFTGKNFELGRIDFLLAHRKYTLAMLDRAKEQPVLSGKFKVKVIRADDLVGLKVQSSSNDPERYHQDMADIRLLIKNNYDKLDMNLVREYFALFDRENELEKILKGIEDVK